VNNAFDLETKKLIVLQVLLDVDIVQFGLKFDGVLLAGLWGSGSDTEKSDKDDSDLHFVEVETKGLLERRCSCSCRCKKLRD